MMFICFEGIAGAGKTTQSFLLKERLENLYKKDCLISAAFEGKRKLQAEAFVADLSKSPSPTMIMFTFQTLHALQYQEVSLALNIGKFVVADRWRESFFAYHNFFGPLSREDPSVRQILDRITFHDLDPDVTFLLDAPASVALERFSNREKDTRSCLRSPDALYFETMREYYLEIAEKKGWIYIDSDRTIDKIHQDIISYL